MPRIVDHDARRKEIILATWRVVAARGLAATTIREIAREAGCSTGTLAHYFSDRGEIIASAMAMAHRTVRARADAKIGNARGLEALRILMIEALPLDEQRTLEARIEACFWGEAVGNDRLMRLQNSEVDIFCSRVRERLIEAEKLGELEAGVHIAAIVDELLVLMDGCSIQAVLNPKRLPSACQITHLEALLSRIRRNSVPVP